MSYETTKIVKTLRFPGDTDNQYQINAVALSGLTRQKIEERLNSIESFDALRYMGSLNQGDTLPAANKGDVYKIAFNGTIAGAKVEIGDMLICNTDDTPENTPNNWDIIQSNIDVASILDHYHTGSVTFTKSDKTLTHSVTAPTGTIDPEFTNGAASIVGDHGHDASGSVTITAQGSVETATITPKGKVKLTEVETAGDKDVTVTLSGSIGNATTVTSVQAGNTTVSAHSASSEEAGSHAHTGKVTVNEATQGGSVSEHKHNVAINDSKGNFFNTVSYKDNTGKVNSEYNGDEGILEFGFAQAVVSVTATEDSIAPTFTGVAHTHGASVEIDAAAAHTHTINVADHAAFVPSINVTSTEHTHTFTGDAVNIHGEFEGDADTHNHTFTGTAVTADVTVTVEDFEGNFEGTVTGDIEVTTNEFVTSVSVGNHTVNTVDSGSFTTGSGLQE